MKVDILKIIALIKMNLELGNLIDTDDELKQMICKKMNITHGYAITHTIREGVISLVKESEVKHYEGN